MGSQITSGGGGAPTFTTMSGNITGSRSNNVVYQNTTNLPMCILIHGYWDAGGFSQLRAYVGLSSPPTLLVAFAEEVYDHRAFINFVVPAGYFYKVATGVISTGRSWVEYV